MSRGRLIVLEGGEGAGKSTQARHVASWLRRQGRSVLRTREPGGSPLAEAIREVVLGRWREGMPPVAELLLMFAARAAHLEARIRPALAAGRDVVCDRFVDASHAYQGGGRGQPARDIDALERMVLGRLKPDLVLLLDIDPAKAGARVRRRGQVDRFDREALAFQRRVRAAYLRRARRAPRRYAVVDAGGSEAEVRAAIETVLRRRLGRR